MKLSEIQNLSAQEYQDWRTFQTPLDNPRERVLFFLYGLEVGCEAFKVEIDERGTWFADYGHITRTDYRIIGYHPNTADFWNGVLASEAPIIIYRFDEMYRMGGTNSKRHLSYWDNKKKKI